MEQIKILIDYIGTWYQLWEIGLFICGRIVMFNQLFLNGIIAGNIYELVALGFAIVYRTVKFFNVTQWE